MTALPTTAPLDLAARWGGRSHVTDLGGPVHWVDFGGPAGPPPLVLVHGLGGSHLNWVQVAPRLAESRRVVVIDLAGFGLTPGIPPRTSVNANAAMLGRFVREVLGGPVVLVGNSMGGMVSLILASRLPDLVTGLVLLAPALPAAGTRMDGLVAAQFGVYATPWVGSRVLQRYQVKYTARQRVLNTIALCFAEPRRADPDVIDAGIELTDYRDAQGGGVAGFLGAARSLLNVLRRRGRYAALIGALEQPVLLIHGDRDRLVPIAAARKVAASNPGWDTEWLDGVGHTPQLETPDLILARVIPWLDRLAARAA